MNKPDIKNLLGADPKALAASLTDADRRLLETLIADPVARAKFLSSKEATAIMDMLQKGDNDGRP